MNKKKLLCWSDSATASTGFGTVSKYIIGALHATGKYDIEHLAINWHGSFYDKNEIPWLMSPAKVMDPRDPHGTQMFLRAVAQGNYDLVWVLNDTYVVHKVAEPLKKLFAELRSAGKKVPKIIYYYPVDCRIQRSASGLIDIADRIVAYTDHGMNETLESLPEVKDKMSKIHHGVDTSIFKPYSKRIITDLRKKWFNADDEMFIVMNANRNSVRKQLTKTLVAFKEFQGLVPNSLLYLHTMPREKDIDLIAAMNHIGLEMKKDVFFPPNYSPSKGYPAQVLNEFYNCANVFLTTHLGEGWGLTVTEAMAAGTPVIAPANTSMPEILGYGERGYLYECKELIYVDNSGFRPMGLIDDIVNEMMRVYRGGWKHELPKVVQARKWVETNSWEIITKQWIQLFEEVENIKDEEIVRIVGEEV